MIKRELRHGNYKDGLFNDTIILRSQQRFKSFNHEIYTEEVNKVALSSDDDKGLQTFNKIQQYPYITSPNIVWENERLMLCEAEEKLKILEEKFEMQNKKCKSEMCAKEKEKWEVFFKNVKERCKREMQKYMKLKNINNDKFW